MKWPCYDAWLRGFLLGMYLRAYASLDPGGVCLVNISNTPSNPELARLEEDSCAVAREAGFVGAGVLEMRKPGPAEGAGDAGSVKHPPARVRAEHAHRPEKIFVFRKPADAKP